ncbi:MAG: helix-turn-helix domain-containing protein [Rhodospirillales bacterium]|nr:helix-turn-helix domain-containing protein [Rhodospirillales bacterium]
MTEEEDAALTAAAESDPDNPPLTEEQMAKMRRISPDVKTLRKRLGMTQERFARTYRLPLGTVRDWEQGRSLPDAPAQALLTVIAAEPEATRRALEAG